MNLLTLSLFFAGVTFASAQFELDQIFLPVAPDPTPAPGSGWIPLPDSAVKEHGMISSRGGPTKRAIPTGAAPIGMPQGTFLAKRVPHPELQKQPVTRTTPASLERQSQKLKSIDSAAPAGLIKTPMPAR